jgi:predicted nucleic acid-binding protein
VIYVDASVLLAELFTEARNPPPSFWRQSLVSSRLLEYEVWNRIHVRNLPHSLVRRAEFLLEYIQFLEMTPSILERALKPFPAALRTLDALHVASLDYAHQRDATVVLASYDKQMLAAARALDIPIHGL